MNIGIITENLDAFRQQVIHEIEKMAPAYGHTARSYVRELPTRQAPANRASTQKTDELEYIGALADMDVLICFSSRERDFAAGHAPLLTLVAILNDQSGMEQLRGSIRCVWVDQRQAVAQAFEHVNRSPSTKTVVNYMSIQPKPPRKLRMPSDIQPSPMGQQAIKIRSTVDINYIVENLHSGNFIQLNRLPKFRAFILEDAIATEKLKEKALTSWHVPDMAVICANHSPMKKKEQTGITSEITRFDFCSEEVAYQTLMACELPRPSHPQVVHIEPCLIPVEQRGNSA